MEGAKQWTQWTKEELDLQYSPSKWSKRMGPEEVIEAHVAALTSGSTKAKESVECQLDISYGISEKEKLDIFGANTLPGDAPIFVYIHGGYWQFMSREVSSFMVPPLAESGAMVAVLGYDIAPQASMETIVSQIKKGVAYVMNLAKRRGSSGIYLSGHSAGAHLAAMMLSVDWMSEFMCSHGLIKGAALVSGVYDIRPLVNSYVNDPLKMTMESAWENSPEKCMASIIEKSSKRKIIVAVGQNDPPEFRRQSQEFSQSLKRSGMQVVDFDIPTVDHFDAIENLSNKDYSVTKEIIKMMNLNVQDIVSGLEATEVK